MACSHTRSLLVILEDWSLIHEPYLRPALPCLIQRWFTFKSATIGCLTAALAAIFIAPHNQPYPYIHIEDIQIGSYFYFSCLHTDIWDTLLKYF